MNWFWPVLQLCERRKQCNTWWNLERVRQGTKRISGRTQDALMFKRESAVFDKRILNWELRLNLRQTWQTRINICLPRKWDIYKTNVLFQVSDSVSLGFIHNLLLCSWCFSCYSAPINWLVHGLLTSVTSRFWCVTKLALAGLDFLICGFQCSREEWINYEIIPWNRSYIELRIQNQVKLWSSQLWTQFLQLHREPWKMNSEVRGSWPHLISYPQFNIWSISYIISSLRKLWRQIGNNSLLLAKCWPLLLVMRACSWRSPDIVGT